MAELAFVVFIIAAVYVAILSLIFLVFMAKYLYSYIRGIINAPPPPPPLPALTETRQQALLF